jgi:hypothetical protein
VFKERAQDEETILESGLPKTHRSVENVEERRKFYCQKAAKYPTGSSGIKCRECKGKTDFKGDFA